VLSISVLTALIATLLVVISFALPLADRARLPYTVVLAVVGAALASFAAFLLYTPITDAFNDIVEPLVKFPISAPVFLTVFLPLLLFHAALTIDVRELVDDAAPILTLAVVAVFVCAAGIGFALFLGGQIPITIALLTGSIVATTDPAAVVAIFRDLGVPPRLVRLVEGESLLNDAAAIVLFGALLKVIEDGGQPSLAEGTVHFIVSFGGGLLLGFLGGRLFGALSPMLGGARPAEVTLSLALPYLVYLVGEEIFEISGVVAVVSAGLTAGAIGRNRFKPDNWQYLEQVWEQIGFWAGSLIFIMASLLIPRLLSHVEFRDVWLLALVVVSAFVTRAAVLFGLLPVLTALHLSRHINAAYKLAITWGGLRGAVTLALALAVTENPHIDASTQSLIAVLSTGFVLFTLLFNGLTLRPAMRLLKLDRLSPLNRVLRSKVLGLALAEVQDAVEETSRKLGLTPAVTNAVISGLEQRRKANNLESGPSISEEERITVGLITLTTRERRIILNYHARQSVSAASIERLLRETDLLLEATKAEGQSAYSHSAARQLGYSANFRFAHLLHRRLGIERFLRQEISGRYERLLVHGLALKELHKFNDARLSALVGKSTAEYLSQMLSFRLEGTTRALEALQLQYPEYATKLEQHFLRQTGLKLEVSLFRQLADEGIIGTELYSALEREHAAERRHARDFVPLDLGLRTEQLIPRLELFRDLNAAEIKALARLFKPRLAVPEEKIVRKGQRGMHAFFISSGAVEVLLGEKTVRLGRGEFFGEMALLSGRPRAADVIALGYCQLLVLSAADFHKFLKNNPVVKTHIDSIAMARASMNNLTAASAATLP
jgi:Na+:H+ antiporter